MTAWTYRLSDEPAGPYREVLAEVRRLHTRRAVSEATGVSDWTLTKIEKGYTAYVRRDTADRLRAALPKMLPTTEELHGGH